MGEKFDYGAWATRTNIRCADGRTIRKGAFKDMDGKVVPLIWNHDHKDPKMVFGHALLKDRDEGTYAYLKFNTDTELGRHCKSLVDHGDVKSVSIYANELDQSENGDVFHGNIREVSLVLAGANPGAYIDTILAHKEDLDSATMIYPDEDQDVSFQHGIMTIDDNEVEDPGDPNENEDNENTETSEEANEANEEKPEEELSHSAESSEKGDEAMDDNKTVGEVFEDIKKKLTDEEMNVIYGIVGMAAEGQNEEGDEDMKHNAFEGDFSQDELMHSAMECMEDIWQDSKRFGSLKESFLQHADEVQQYGIDHMEYFQTPEGTDIYDTPQFIKRQPDGWVDKVLGGVHHTPFSKIRMMFADITEDEARAKGYIKGNLKKEEFFKLIKRTVSPTTIYKKQKFDRDDLADADFNVIPWIKSEMGMMLNEEKARAYIFGDGRSASDDDKIDETKIIPVVADSELFTIKVEVEPAQGEALEHAIINTCVLAQDDYRGSGSLVGFAEAKTISKMMLQEDQFGHRLYKTLAELASAMNLSDIVRVPKDVMPADTYLVALDLRDYNVGVKDMGKKSWYDDFDIDYNQMKYLLEERQSGALTRPKSAIVLIADQG